MTSRPVIQPLVRLRRRLTAWYAATFGLILLLLGGGLYVVIHRQFERQLKESLEDAASELVAAARVREREATDVQEGVVDAVDAVDELHIPDRILYLLDSAGAPIKPDSATHWIRSAARHAALAGTFEDRRDIGQDHTLWLHARAFRLASGQLLAAVAVADEVELADRFADLIAAFGAAALAAVVLVLAGGYILVRKSTEPVERSFAYTRRFMADAAHELRTPISVMRTRADVALGAARSPDAYATVLRGMSQEAERMGRVVDDLLMLARADAGERPIARERFFLDDVVIDAALSARPLAQTAGVELAVDEFEETAIVGDAALVRELVVVLLDNAVQFTPPGGSVRVRVQPLPSPTLTVDDTGCGIPADQLPHVFERFYRGDSSRPRAGGAGLGLAIAQWIAEVHGARIALASEPGRGVRVTVVFPRPAPVDGGSAQPAL